MKKERRKEKRGRKKEKEGRNEADPGAEVVGQEVEIGMCSLFFHNLLFKTTDWKKLDQHSKTLACSFEFWMCPLGIYFDKFWIWLQEVSWSAYSIFLRKKRSRSRSRHGRRSRSRSRDRRHKSRRHRSSERTSRSEDKDRRRRSRSRERSSKKSSKILSHIIYNATVYLSFKSYTVYTQYFCNPVNQFIICERCNMLLNLGKRVYFAFKWSGLLVQEISEHKIIGNVKVTLYLWPSYQSYKLSIVCWYLRMKKSYVKQEEHGSKVRNLI